ncbi:MFS transporter [Thermodesulfobacteriota bacterium]
MFESFQLRDFRWLWVSTFAHAMAMGMQMMARGWLVLRLSNDSPLALSLIMVSFSLPLSFMSLIGGALADRVQRKHIIIAAQVGCVFMTTLLAVLDMTGLVKLWHLVAIGAINGSLMAIIMPSRQAIISDLVPPEALMNAISLNNSGMNLTRVIGPALAGVLIVFIDTAGVFYLISAVYVFSLLAMAVVRAPTMQRKSQETGMVKDISTGLKYVVKDPVLLGLVITLFMPVFFGFSLLFLLPAWAREVMDMQSEGIGILMMVMGAGSLAGSLILAASHNLGKRGVLLLINGVFWGCAITIFSQSTTYIAALPLLFIVGLMTGVFMPLHMTLMQVYSSREMRGRIMSLAMMSFGATPLSALPFGAIAEKIGTPGALSISGLMMAFFTVIFAVVYPKFRKIG